MKSKENRKPQLFILFSLFLSMAFFACSENKVKRDKVITLKIFSPTDCQYTLLVTKDSLHVESLNISYSQKKKAMDTLLLRLDTAFAKRSQKTIANNIDSIDYWKFPMEKIQKNDAYHFEIYSDDRLLGRGWCCDTAVTKLLKECIPYIEMKKIVCSNFFDMIDPTIDSVR